MATNIDNVGVVLVTCGSLTEGRKIAGALVESGWRRA